MIRNFLMLFIVITLLGCKDENTKSQEDAKPDHLPELFALMQGSFNSEVQSQVDSTYFNISLHMYPIWKDKGNFYMSNKHSTLNKISLTDSEFTRSLN